MGSGLRPSAGPGTTLCVGQRIDDMARMDDVTLIHDVARTFRVRLLNLIHLSNSPTQTCVIVRSQRTASSLRSDRRENAAPQTRTTRAMILLSALSRAAQM